MANVKLSNATGIAEISLLVDMIGRSYLESGCRVRHSDSTLNLIKIYAADSFSGRFNVKKATRSIYHIDGEIYECLIKCYIS